MARRILFLVSSMHGGGAERVAANLANCWAARGDLVTLLITFSGRGECFYSLSETVSLLYLTDTARCRGAGVRTYGPRLLALRRLVLRSRPDVVVSFLSTVNVAAIIATRGLHCGVIVAEHCHPPAWPVGRVWAILRRITYAWAHRVVLLAPEGLQWLHTHVPAARGTVIPNPVVYPLPGGRPVLSPDDIIPSGRRLLLAVGRLDGGKQFDRLLDAFASLVGDNPSWDLVVVGEGPERSELEHRVVRLALQRRVILPGRAGNIGDWYSRADLYVMSSRAEGFPNTLAEAMAHGCAAVSYDCDTGPRDLIRHEIDGLLVSPVGDVLALAHALRRLMADGPERQRMAARAVEVRQRYSLEKVRALWDELFDEVTALRPPP